MKLQPLALVVFLISPPSAANFSRRHCRTLSAAAKKPASRAGFLFLKLNLTLRFAPFLSLAPHFHSSLISSTSLLKLQIASNPA